MVSLSRNSSLDDYVSFVNAVYGVPNDRYYTLWDMLTNIQRFAMRSIKGVRKNNRDKVTTNLLITLSWFTSLMNRLHVDLGDMIWERFPCKCSYCGVQPCVCKAEKVSERRKVTPNGALKPRTINDFQIMFDRIYPASARSPQDAAIHLAEEAGELSEAFHVYMGDRSEEHLQEIYVEAADFFSCIMGVMNSVGINCAEELEKTFPNNCHVCHNAPCTCSFQAISSFRS